jgi:hypothetical protein
MDDDSIELVPVLATCRTDGCAYNGKPSALNKPSGPGTHIVVCAECSVEITDIVPVNE